jgi:hypothetical protein
MHYTTDSDGAVVTAPEEATQASISLGIAREPDSTRFHASLCARSGPL